MTGAPSTPTARRLAVKDLHTQVIDALNHPDRTIDEMPIRHLRKITGGDRPVLLQERQALAITALVTRLLQRAERADATPATDTAEPAPEEAP
jgi:hypothetical protein